MAADPPSLSLTSPPAGTAHRPAVVLDGGPVLSYRDLDALTAELAADLARPRKALVLCRMARNLPSLLGYLACLRLGHCVLLVEDASPDTVGDLLAAYRPELVVDGTGEPLALPGHPAVVRVVDGHRIHLARAPGNEPPPRIHPDTAVLLRTSGSIDGAKTVRLTYRNIAANARAIASALGLTPSDRAPTTLPLSYSFGLSVVNSHLAAGASIALTDRSPTGARFWPWAARAGCTGFYAVPLTFRLLRARGWRAAGHERLRALHVAGGALDPATVRLFAEQMAGIAGHMTVMYGQTEATARISCLVVDPTTDDCSSVGRPIPGGEVWIESTDAPGHRLPDGETGEVFYRGPNVMQGYANDRSDLARGDEHGGVLATGDLGYLRSGRLHVTGRRDRVVKLLGRRVNLDDVERSFGALGREAAAVCVTDRGEARIVVSLVGAGNDAQVAERRRTVADALAVPSSMIRTVRAADLPRGAAGKVSYGVLRRRLTGRPTVHGGRGGGVVTDWMSKNEWPRVLELLRDDQLSRTKPAYAYCTALACIAAEHCGYPAIAVAEFGVAWGEGLRELGTVAATLTTMTGIDVSVVGFDRHGGLPRVADHRDHPEVWHEGQFANQGLEELRDELAGEARLIIGDMAHTVPAFAAELDGDRPLGAVMLDVDLYSSTRDALRVFDGAADAYLPSVPMYVDDVDALLTFNGRCGEAAAIAEYNRSARERFIEAKRVRVGWAAQRWHEKVYACHVLDHPVRNGKPPALPLEIHVDQY